MHKFLLLALLLMLALVLELSALGTLWSGGIQDRIWFEFLLLHALSSMPLALAGWYLMPPRYRYPRWVALLFLFNFSFFMPVLGMLGLYGAVLIAGYRRRAIIFHPFRKLVLPEFVLSLREPDMKFSQGGIKSRLVKTSVPTPLRLQSLLALQGIPSCVSTPLLQDMLGDTSDDIRLVAYGLLDGREKKIAARIHDELGSLRQTVDGEERVNILKQLAELYWEMVYAGLAQGDLRIHALNQALSYANEALQRAAGESGMLLLKGRTLHALRRTAEAKQTLETAIRSGLPESRALPYLVEIAFEQREFKAVRSLLGRLSGNRISPTMKKVIDFWSNRQSEPDKPVQKEYAL